MTVKWFYPIKLVFIAVLISSSVATAQREETVNLQFVSFPRVANAKPLQLLVGEGEVIDVEIPTNRLSQTYKVPKLNAWVLGELATEGENVQFKRHGQVQSSNSKNQIVMVIRNPKEGEDKVELFLLNNGGKGLAGGDCFIMNFSKVEIGGVVGKKKFVLKPRGRKTISPAPDRVVRGRRFAFANLYYRKENRLEPFFEKQWRLSKNANSMVFVYHDPHNDRLRLHAIRNFIN